jgi:hypothetical protein
MSWRIRCLGVFQVAALQWLAACEVGHCLIAFGGELASAEGLFGVVDASDEVTKVDMGVFAVHDPQESSPIGDDAARSLKR